MSSVKPISKEMKTNLIYIYSYNNKTLCGAIFNPFIGEKIYFENALQLMLITENLLDFIGFPQKSMDKRTVYEETNINYLNNDNKPDFSSFKPIATFELEVIFRQNASWQGVLNWVDKNSIYSYRSFLELLTLLDNILQN